MEIQEKSSEIWMASVVGFALFAAVLFGIYSVFNRYSIVGKETSIFLEMKVLDEQGHPVAGADIFRDKKQIGVTDSFGEWNQMMTVQLGSKISLLIRKKNGKHVIRSMKSIPIPSVLLDSETRIKANVHLRNTSDKKSAFLDVLFKYF